MGHQEEEKRPNICVVLLHYLYDSRERDLRSLCNDMQKAHVYESCKKFMNTDPILKQAQQERKASNIENRSFAIKRLQKLLTHKVDWLSVCRVKSQVNCSGLNHSQVLHHAEVDLSFCHKHWDYSRGAWRARKCHGSTHLDEETAFLMGWKNVGENSLQCPACANAKKTCLVALLEPF